MSFFDNSHMAYQVGQAWNEIRNQQRLGNEVLMVKVTGLKSIIEVDQGRGMPTLFKRGGFAGCQRGELLIVWREAEAPAPAAVSR